MAPVIASAQLLVWSMGNSQSNTQNVANWLSASGQFGSVTAYDGTALTQTDLQAYQQVLFFSNSDGGSDPNVGDALAEFASTGRRLVVATFAYANQGANTVGGLFITNSISPVTFNAVTLYSTASLGTTDGSAFFTGVNTLSGYYRDSVTAAPGAVVRATWSDGKPLLVTLGNVVAITLFPDNSYSDVTGDYQQLFVNALTVGMIPEPSTWLLLGLGAALLLLRRRFA
ncbi:MAG: PEP-CTERM sorting domain-containing protein [Opitutales bacterium]